MTQALLEGEAGAPVQTQRMILILISVQAEQEEEGERAGPEPPLMVQMSPVFETEVTASVGVLQEQDVVGDSSEDSVVQEGGQVVVEGSLERRVA
jgi:hypothetical protein